jgi:hypothetical protein
VRDDAFVDVDADNAARDLNQQIATVALAASYIENVLIAAEPQREQVAMIVLALDIAEHSGQVALAGDLQVAGGPREAKRLVARRIAGERLLARFRLSTTSLQSPCRTRSLYYVDAASTALAATINQSARRITTIKREPWSAKTYVAFARYPYSPLSRAR